MMMMMIIEKKNSNEDWRQEVWIAELMGVSTVVRETNETERCVWFLQWLAAAVFCVCARLPKISEAVG